MSTQFNDIFYGSGPVKAMDTVSNRYNIIHEKLYNEALEDFLNNYQWTVNQDGTMTLEEGTGGLDAPDSIWKYCKFSEIPDSEYWQPSDVQITYMNPTSTQGLKFNQIRIDLTEFWNNEYIKKNMLKDHSDLYLRDDTLRDAQIVYTDYVRGKVVMKSRYTGEEFEVDFDYVNGNTRISPEATLEDTFGYKYRNR